MATTTSNSKNVTLVANTQQTVSWTQYFETIVVSNGGTAPVFLTTDGTTVTSAEAGANCVLAGAVGVFSNAQLKPVPAQSAAGATSVSVISSGTGLVVVTPQ